MLCRLHQTVNVSFIYPSVRITQGRPSIDPEVAFRAMVLGYLDYRLHQKVQMHVGYR